MLQDGEYIPVGSRKPRKANVRVIAATNEDLARAVKEGKFREDLWFRLRVVPLRLPPLRERREDIPLLVEHFIDKHALRLGRPPLAPDPDAMRSLLDHPWPGNIRESSTRSSAACSSRAATRSRSPICRRSSPRLAADPAGGVEGYRRARDAWERKFLEDLLREAGGNVAKAADAAGLHRSTLYEKLQRYGLVEKDAKA